MDRLDSVEAIPAELPPAEEAPNKPQTRVDVGGGGVGKPKQSRYQLKKSSQKLQSSQKTRVGVEGGGEEEGVEKPRPKQRRKMERPRPKQSRKMERPRPKESEEGAEEGGKSKKRLRSPAVQTVQALQAVRLVQTRKDIMHCKKY